MDEKRLAETWKRYPLTTFLKMREGEASAEQVIEFFVQLRTHALEERAEKKAAEYAAHVADLVAEVRRLRAMLVRCEWIHPDDDWV